MTRKLRPAPPPREANDQLVTAVITAAWVIGLISVLVLRDQLAPSQRWWVWTCAVGVCMGLFGLWYVPRLKRSRTRAAERRARARAEAQAAAQAGAVDRGEQLYLRPGPRARDLLASRPGGALRRSPAC